jgi:hypothetical protein
MYTATVKGIVSMTPWQPLVTLRVQEKQPIHIHRGRAGTSSRGRCQVAPVKLAAQHYALAAIGDPADATEEQSTIQDDQRSRAAKLLVY